MGHTRRTRVFGEATPDIPDAPGYFRRAHSTCPDGKRLPGTRPKCRGCQGRYPTLTAFGRFCDSAPTRLAPVDYKKSSGERIEHFLMYFQPEIVTRCPLKPRCAPRTGDKLEYQSPLPYITFVSCTFSSRIWSFLIRPSFILGRNFLCGFFKFGRASPISKRNFFVGGQVCCAGTSVYTSGLEHKEHQKVQHISAPFDSNTDKFLEFTCK